MAAARSRRPPATTLARRWLVVALIALIGYAYYHPLRSWISTRAELGSRRAEVAQRPAHAAGGQPFPTASGLAGRHLVPAASRLEAAGGVERGSRAAATAPELGASLERANNEQRRVRPELDLGVGGARTGAGSLKCLH